MDHVGRTVMLLLVIGIGNVIGALTGVMLIYNLWLGIVCVAFAILGEGFTLWWERS